MASATESAALPGVAMRAERLCFCWAADDPERAQVIAQHPEAGLVSPTLPLRANLTVLENIAVVPEFRCGDSHSIALERAWSLLQFLGQSECAHRRDPDLDDRERFLAKLARAIVGSPPAIVIDRPALLLPNFNYPPALDAALLRLEGHYQQCLIVDYVWNAILYPKTASAT